MSEQAKEITYNDVFRWADDIVFQRDGVREAEMFTAQVIRALRYPSFRVNAHPDYKVLIQWALDTTTKVEHNYQLLNDTWVPSEVVKHYRYRLSPVKDWARMLQLSSGNVTVVRETSVDKPISYPRGPGEKWLTEWVEVGGCSE